MEWRSEWINEWGNGWTESEGGVGFVWEADAHCWQREQCVQELGDLEKRDSLSDDFRFPFKVLFQVHTGDIIIDTYASCQCISYEFVYI